MFRLFLFPLLCFTFACLEDDDALPPEMMPAMETTTITFDNLRYLALGDSYTIGTAVTEEERWPYLLSQQLEAKNSNPAKPEIDLDIVAVNGWTTRDLITGIQARQQQLLPEYDLVSLLIGVNNQYQGRSLAEYRVEFEELLNTAIRYAGGDTSRVLVVSIPDYAFTPFGGGSEQITNELIEFNAVGKSFAEQYHVPFLNITPISQEAEADPELVASDTLHPSGKQYARWVKEVLLEKVEELVGSN